MKRIIRNTFIILGVIIVTAFATYRITMLHLNIETDGDGDSATVTVFGQSDLYGINGYSVK
jgi:hypothetical protein